MAGPGIISVPDPLAGLTTGHPTELLPGTGESGPGGVESVLEYRGTFLNQRGNNDTYLVTNIDGLADADVRDTRDVNPSDHGETAFEAFYGGRTIVLTGKIRSYTLGKLRDMQQGLRETFADVSKEYPLIFHSPQGRTMQIFCKKSQPMAWAEAQQNFQFERDFQVTLRASDPRFTSLQTEYQQIAVPSSPTLFTMSNEGNFDALPTFRITGPINNPEIQLIHGEAVERIKLNANIPAGETWVIDRVKKTIKTTTGVNKFAAFDVTSDWVLIHPGRNNLQIVGTGMTGATQLITEHRHTWI